MRCNGCVVGLQARVGHEVRDRRQCMKVAVVDQRLAIKSQKRVDMGPFVRFAAGTAPIRLARALPVRRDHQAGRTALWTSTSRKCDPSDCQVNGQYPCAVELPARWLPEDRRAVATRRTSDKAIQVHAVQRSRRCDDVAGAVAERAAHPRRRTHVRGSTAPAVPELAHEPACVSTCPAKAMFWDTQANIMATCATGQRFYVEPTRLRHRA